MHDNHGITAENLLRTLPDVLRNDANTLALASAVADELAARVGEIDKLRIYTRIDELPEDLLDILAYDFKVDWYGYDYGIEAKRALIKDSFRVHRHLGTRGAVETALSDIYPGSVVEEWFEYGGNPFYFRIILDVTDQRVAISHSEIARTVNIYKSLRSHLEDDAITYRSRVGVIVGASCGYVLYSIRPCGTFPARATEGGIDDIDIAVITDSGGASYAVPRSGTSETGLYPEVATQGGVDLGEIDMGANGYGAAYNVRICGTAPGGLI
jgi:phage tail P2-like protein